MNTTVTRSTADPFNAPPANPLALLREWLQAARDEGVRDPQHMALATANTDGQASNRTVSLITVRDSGLVFATHTDSPKGRDLAQTEWSSGLLYWREVLRQVIISGPTRSLPSDQAEQLWAARPVEMHPMSVLSKQSAPLEDEALLRTQARDLGRIGKPLPRPATWMGYLIEPATVEFWQSGDPDRLYQRLLYERDNSSWLSRRLQP